jgi:NitT/TauT family transport system ATP-binding protein
VSGRPPDAEPVSAPAAEPVRATNASAPRAAGGAPKLSACDVRIQYRVKRLAAPFVAVDGASLEVEQGKIVTLVGPSGCGKTSFLYAIAGLLPIGRGSVLVEGKRIEGPGTDRSVVFQEPTLMPWRTVSANIRLGLELAGECSREEMKRRVAHFVQLVGLTGFENAYPAELSGGMQQRVNLARALANEPELLLLDEPFSALDAQTRERMQTELLRILGETGTTCIFVTHDIVEAVYLADKVVVFGGRPGRVREILPIDLPWPRSPELKHSDPLRDYGSHIWPLLVEDAGERSPSEMLGGGTP